LSLGQLCPVAGRASVISDPFNVNLLTGQTIRKSEAALPQIAHNIAPRLTVVQKVRLCRKKALVRIEPSFLHSKSKLPNKKTATFIGDIDKLSSHKALLQAAKSP